LAPNPNLVEWLDRTRIDGKQKKALVVACGLGDDADALAQRGFDVVACDISQTAIEWCRKRFPRSKVNYVVADLFNPPAGWHRAFNFVLEAYTLQSLPEEATW
jgi:ubiquinone/menaquinone biosynthesis C-methylase UbiE